jgi:hypothetical protein
MYDTLHVLTRVDFSHLKRDAVKTLQVNLGYRCNEHMIVRSATLQKSER